jgi:hypothetical protein
MSFITSLGTEAGLNQGPRLGLVYAVDEMPSLVYA